MSKFLRKAKANLERRIKHFEEMKKRSKFGGREYTKPGSLKK